MGFPPHATMISKTIMKVQCDLKEVKNKMRKGNMRVNQIGHDESFTMYEFHYNGYDEQHNYFNPRIRNKCEKLLNFYFEKKDF